MKLFAEGKARINASEGKISADLDVFYNPVMKLNRDVSIWLVKQLKPKRILDAMAASGVRAIRMALEADAKDIIANDSSKTAYDAMMKNIALNDVGEKVRASNEKFQEICKTETFDYIDIDPFGTPAYAIKYASAALNENGILAITATDTSCLCGRYVKACERKYGSRPMKCGFSKELGIRIMIQNAIASSQKPLVPIFVHSSNHYMRVYLRYDASSKDNNKMPSEIGFVHYCPACLRINASDGKEESCCGKAMLVSGPLWLGKLWDKELAEKFDLIPHIAEESKIDHVGFYDTHEISRILKKDAARVDKLISRLNEAGFLASRTHFKPEGIRTNASIDDLKLLL